MVPAAAGPPSMPLPMGTGSGGICSSAAAANAGSDSGAAASAVDVAPVAAPSVSPVLFQGDLPAR